MKKSLIIAAIGLLVSATATAQLLVRPNGTVRIGENYLEDIGWIPYNLSDTISMLQIFGNESYPERARIAFGDQIYGTPLKAMIGRLYVEDDLTDVRLWMHGQKGFSLTKGSSASDTIVQFRHGVNYVDFKYPIKSEGVLLTSDERCKKDINDLNGALETLAGLRSVTYHYKANPSPLAKVDMSAFNTEEAMKAYVEEEQGYADYEAARTAKLRYGFIAQELEQVLPDLVERDGEGMLSVDYIALVPILVSAVNELSGELATVKADNEELRRQLSTPAVNHAPAQSSGLEQLLTDRSTEVLAQNDPNPFSSDTRISYNLPEGTTTAMICIYDLQGKQVQQLPVTDMGSGSVTLHGGNLQAGMYIYSLIANGHELASKKMILTK